MTPHRHLSLGQLLFWLITITVLPFRHCYWIYLRAACLVHPEAVIQHWMWKRLPHWHFLPVQHAAGSEGDNANSHWSSISILLSADCRGVSWPQAVSCGMSGLTWGKAITIYYIKRFWSTVCLNAVKLRCCTLWMLTGGKKNMNQHFTLNVAWTLFLRSNANYKKVM